MTNESKRNWESYLGTGLIAFNEEKGALALRQSIEENNLFAVVLLTEATTAGEILEVHELEGMDEQEAKKEYLKMVENGGFVFASFS